MFKRTILAAALPLWCLLAGAQTSIQLVPVATGLTDIVDIVHANDDRIFCVLQGGTVRIVQNDAVLTTPFLNITSQVISSGERGLLGLAFDPGYADNGWFYVHYTAPGGNGITRVSRYTVSADPNVADQTTEQILFSYPQPYTNHNGGDLEFGPDGMLYISLGDGGSGGDPDNYSQNLGDPLGSILRIDVSNGGADYEIPADNPFAGVAGDTVPEIWASGLRNPWRFGFDALTGDVWIGDVGQNAWEEVNFWPAEDHSGPNFGWRCYEGLVPYDLDGCAPADEYVFPVAVHPTNFNAWCSVVGGRVYRGSSFPNLYGHYIYTDFCAGVFYSLLPDGDGGWDNELLASGQGSGFTCIGEDSQLELYVGNRSTNTLYRIVDPLNVATPELNTALQFNIFPVPAQEQLIVEGELDQVSTVQLFDQAGRLASSHSIAGQSTRSVLNVSSLSNGSYVLVLLDKEGRQLNRKLVSVVH